MSQRITCPSCHGATKVYSTRGPERWRKCEACDYRFRTREVIQKVAISRRLRPPA